jgi:dTDP-4-dehydrorhamnose 3,5-epimerase
MPAMGIATVPGLPDLPEGVLVRPLVEHRDPRGALSEVFRQEWATGMVPVQWSVTRSQAGVLRGVHLHPRHHDYLVVLEGHATAALRDLRPASPTSGLVASFSLRGDPLLGVTIPCGVAHGFLFHQPTLYLVAASETWDPDDELGCHWADPALGIDWPARPTCLSDRDLALPSLGALLEGLAARRAR